MKLLLVWCPRFFDESRSVEHSMITTSSSCSLVVNTRCRVVPLSSWNKTLCRGHDVLQPILFQTYVRRSNRARYTLLEIRETWHKLCDDTVGSVRCGHEGLQRPRSTVLSTYFSARKQDSIEQKKGADPRTEQPTREPSCGNLAELRRRLS